MTEPAVTIRAARVEDAEHIRAVETDIARTPGLLNAEPGEFPLEAYQATIGELGPAGAYLVAETPDGLVGHAFLEPMQPRRRNHVRILNIAVRPGCSGKGIGSQLLAQLLDWAEARGVRKIELNVRAGNSAARRLYERFGFREEGRLRQRLRLPDGSYEDDLSMALFLGKAKG